MIPDANPSPQRRKPISTLLFAAGAFWLLVAGWEMGTGHSLPTFGRLSSRSRPVSEDQAYTTIFVAGALLTVGCFRKAWEIR